MSDDKRSLSDSIEAVDISKGVDVAATLVAGHADDAPIDKTENTRLLRKLDKHILPLMFLLYIGQCFSTSALLRLTITFSPIH
jgi:MFS transporter, ACS family, allantoate permease